MVAFGIATPATAEPPTRRDPQGALLADVRFEQRLGQPLPLDLSFCDETGAESPLQIWFHDRPVIVALVYYRCPMLCNEILNGLVKALNAQSLSAGRDFDVVVLSIDPTETPDAAFAKKQRVLQRCHDRSAAPGWHFLTGNESSIARLAAAVGFQYRFDPRSSQYAHASGIIVVTPQGRTARYLYGIDYPTRDLRLALVEAASGRIGSPVDQVLLFCFHYDPATGRYGPAIFRLLQAGGIATVTTLAGFVLLSLRAERRRRRWKDSRSLFEPSAEGR